MEVSEIEAEMAEMEREIEMENRRKSIDRLNNGASFYKGKDGKIYPKREDESKGQCAGHVADALRDNKFTIERPKPREGNTSPSACDYGTSYEKAGFLRIASGLKDKVSNKYEAKHGDIVILQPSKKTSKHGHIAIYNGTHWVSDYHQNTPGGIKRTQETNPNLGSGFFPNDGYLNSDYKIYRNPKWVE